MNQDILDLKNKNTLSKSIKDSFILAHRTLLKIKHTPERLIDVTIAPIFFTVIFTYIFGGAIAGDTKSYLPVIIPGLLVQTLLSSCTATGVQLKEDIDKGIFDRFRTLPMARIAPLAGPLIADTVRYIIATCISLLAGYIVGWRPEAGIIGVAMSAVILIGFTFAVSWIFAFIGVMNRSTATAQNISNIIMMCLTFLSNAFVPTETMPSWLQMFVKINPVTHVISCIRELTTTGAFGSETWTTIIGTIVIVLIFAPLTVIAYKKRV